MICNFFLNLADQPGIVPLPFRERLIPVLENAGIGRTNAARHEERLVPKGPCIHGVSILSHSEGDLGMPKWLATGYKKGKHI